MNSENNFVIGENNIMNRIDQIVENVREKLLQRSQKGINKYNTTLNENNKDNFLDHLQMELMDASNYIEKLLVQNKDLIQLITQYPNDQELGIIIRKIYG